MLSESMMDEDLSPENCGLIVRPQRSTLLFVRDESNAAMLKSLTRRTLLRPERDRPTRMMMNRGYRNSVVE